LALTEIDRRLLKQCLARTPGAWQNFVDRFIGLFVHVIRHTAHVRSIPISADEIDDICSEIFVTLMKKDFAVLRHFRGNSSLATYLTVVARRVAVHEMVRRRKELELGHTEAHQAALKAAATTEAGPQRIEDAEEVAALLKQLPPRDADIVRMYHLEGKSYDEISSRLGVMKNSIGPTLSRARQKLQQMTVSSDA
jgi:RNA polymerase sigma-70 factor (ECF subfamily)